MEADIPVESLLGMPVEFVQGLLASKGASVSLEYSAGRMNSASANGRVLRVRFADGVYHLVIGFETYSRR